MIIRTLIFLAALVFWPLFLLCGWMFSYVVFPNDDFLDKADRTFVGTMLLFAGILLAAFTWCSYQFIVYGVAP